MCDRCIEMCERTAITLPNGTYRCMFASVVPTHGVVMLDSQPVKVSNYQMRFWGIPLRDVDTAMVGLVGRLWAMVDVQDRRVVSAYIGKVRKIRYKKQLKQMRLWCVGKGMDHDTLAELEERAYSILVIPLPKRLITLHNHPMLLVHVLPDEGILQFGEHYFEFAPSEVCIMGMPLTGLKLDSILKADDRNVTLHATVMRGTMISTYLGHASPLTTNETIQKIRTWAGGQGLNSHVINQLVHQAQKILDDTLESEETSSSSVSSPLPPTPVSITPSTSSSSLLGPTKSYHSHPQYPPSLPLPHRYSRSYFYPQHYPNSDFGNTPIPDSPIPDSPKPPYSHNSRYYYQGTLASITRQSGSIHVASKKMCVHFESDEFLFMGIPAGGIDLRRLLKEGMSVQMERRPKESGTGGSTFGRGWSTVAWVGEGPQMISRTEQLKNLRAICARDKVPFFIVEELELRAQQRLQKRRKESMHNESLPRSSPYSPWQIGCKIALEQFRNIPLNTEGAEAVTVDNAASSRKKQIPVAQWIALTSELYRWRSKGRPMEVELSTHLTNSLLLRKLVSSLKRANMLVERFQQELKLH